MCFSCHPLFFSHLVLQAQIYFHMLLCHSSYITNQSQRLRYQKTANNKEMKEMVTKQNKTKNRFRVSNCISIKFKSQICVIFNGFNGFNSPETMRRALLLCRVSPVYRWRVIHL